MARKADPDKKKNIITAAITVFSQHGYAGTRIIDVAKAAGVGKGTVYEYFRSKEDLFFATFEHLMEDTGRQMGQIAATIKGSASERLAATSEAVMGTWLPYLDLYGLVLEFWSATTASPGRKRFKAAFQSAYSTFRSAVTALIQEGMACGDFSTDVEPANLASALIGAWDALLLQAWLDPEFDPLGASRAHMAVVLNGLQHSQNDKDKR